MRHCTRPSDLAGMFVGEEEPTGRPVGCTARVVIERPVGCMVRAVFEKDIEGMPVGLAFAGVVGAVAHVGVEAGAGVAAVVAVGLEPEPTQ